MTILVFLYTGIYTYLYRISSLIRGPRPRGRFLGLTQHLKSSHAACHYRACEEAVAPQLQSPLLWRQDLLRINSGEERLGCLAFFLRDDLGGVYLHGGW